MDLGARVMEQSSPIILSSTEEVEQNCPRANEPSGMDVQDGLTCPRKDLEGLTKKPEPVKKECSKKHTDGAL